MSKKKKHHKKTRLKPKISTVFALLITMLLFSYSIAISTQNFAVCNKIKDDDLKEYIGNFTLSEGSRKRNTIYYFELGDGTVLRADPDVMENNENIELVTTARFVYTSTKYPFSSACYCIEMQSTENDMLFLDREVSYSEAKGKGCIGIVLSFVFCLMSITSIYAVIKKW